MHDSYSRLLTAFRAAVKDADRDGREAQVLGDLMEASPQTLTNWKVRGVSKAGALKAEEVFGCSPSFVLDGTEAAITSDPSGSTTATTKLSLGAAALLMAKALTELGDEDRDLIAQQVAHLLRRGPADHIAAAIDALSAVFVTIPPMGVGDSVSFREPVEPASPRAERATATGPQPGGDKPWTSGPARRVLIPSEEPGPRPLHRTTTSSPKRSRGVK